MTDALASRWVSELRVACEAVAGAASQAVAAAIDLGQQLQAAHDSLPYEEFRRMFNNQPDAIASPLPITLQWARSLMRIAQNTALHANVASLPRAVSALAAISSLDAEQIEQGIRDGVLTPKTSTVRAVSFAQRARGGKAWPVAKIDDDELVERAVDYVQNRILRARQRSEALAERLLAALRALVVEPKA